MGSLENILLIFFLGLEFGSFANVCIYRWPRNQSIFSPYRSRCPWCSRTISWSDNIPLLSFLILKGRCRWCFSKISYQYFLVETLMPVLWVSIFYLSRNQVMNSAKWNYIFVGSLMTLVFFLVVTALIDVEWKIIPDQATFTLMFLGLLTAPWNRFISTEGFYRSYLASCTGLIFGGAILWVIGYLGRWIFHKEVMGQGDIKLLAGIGSLLGWEGAFCSLFWGSLLGGFVVLLGFFGKILKRQQYIPFGPLLNGGCLATIFFKLNFFERPLFHFF